MSAIEITDNDRERYFPHMQRAKELGVDIEDAKQVHYLVQALIFCEERFKLTRVHNYKAFLGEKLGISTEDIELMRLNPMVKIASQLIGEAFAERLVQTDLRSEAMRLYADDLMAWLKNLSRIAKGVPTPGGTKPYDKDSIAAAQTLMTIPLGEGFVKMLFDVGDDSTEEHAYLKGQSDLKAGTVIRIEGEVS